jgi:ribosome-binding protein aMBF1 (putative translation factor)
MTSLANLKRRWMRDPEFRREYEALEPAYQLARALIEARSRAGLTQAQVAERMGTTQSVVSRMESGHHLPSMSRILAYAKATHSYPKLVLVKDPSPA